MVKVQGLFAKTNLKIPVCHIRSKQGLGQARPNKKLSQRDKKFSRIENLWPRDDSCSHVSITCDFHSHVSITCDFQAPEFYVKHGYKQVFELSEYPKTGKRHYYKKELQ